MPVIHGQYRRPQLRNDRINYGFGWFFVTFQVAGNKSELGAIVGEHCVLNALGEAVKALIETLQKFNPEVFVDSFVVMPNHVHLILKIEARGATPPCPETTPPRPETAPPRSETAPPRSEVPNNLGRIIGKLKSLAAREYRQLKEKGLVRDIGSKLWQANYWEKIVTNHEQLEAIRAYIANNPKKWSIDRFGPVTAYSLGNLELLNEPFIAFVASQEARPEALVPRVARHNGLAPRDTLGARGCHAPPCYAPPCHAPPENPPVISTFTSPQEREVLRRLMAQKRRFIAVYPGGLPAVLPREIAACVEAGRALLLSPVETGTGINKQRAIWCNEYVIRRAKEVWCGDLKPGGTLESILKGTMGNA